MTIYIGLDMATTTGIAVYYPEDNSVICYQHKGTPVELAVYISNVVHLVRDPNNILARSNTPIIFSAEKLHLVQNMNTVRSLCERYGYIKYSLIAAGYQVFENGPQPPRRFINKSLYSKQHIFDLMRENFTGPFLTSNHTDAIAQAMFVAHSQGDLPKPIIPTIHIGGFE